jgi:outer membrane protein assembly factor BamD
MINKILLVALIAATSILTSCGNSSGTLQTKPTKERFDEAMAALKDENYVKAAELFDIIVTQDPAGDLADDAQFYLGEAHFLNDEFRLAAFHYRRLLNSFPTSPYYKRAMFRAAEAFFNISPSYERDQTDTENAIKQFRVFADLYPGDSLATVAQDRIADLRNKLGHKDFSVAEQYVKMDEYKAALIYYQRVIDLYPDTDYYRSAVLGKVEMLKKLGRDGEATEELQKFRDANPGASLQSNG